MAIEKESERETEMERVGDENRETEVVVQTSSPFGTRHSVISQNKKI
jgi:hypothetical protein